MHAESTGERDNGVLCWIDLQSRYFKEKANTTVGMSNGGNHSHTISLQPKDAKGVNLRESGKSRDLFEQRKSVHL